MKNLIPLLLILIFGVALGFNGGSSRNKYR